MKRVLLEFKDGTSVEEVITQLSMQPKDAKLLKVHQIYEHDKFMFKLEHESYVNQEEGVELPVVNKGE